MMHIWGNMDVVIFMCIIDVRAEANREGGVGETS